MANPISIPVIARELRVQARKPATYYARSAWGLAAAIFLAFVFWLNQAIISNGREMFALMHGALALMLLVTAPIICADTISRERREGSLGLLLLTPLTPMQIVLGKFFSHFFRLLYFWLMMIPFLMMPMIIGGVSFTEFLLSSGVLFSFLLSGLAAGFIASSGAVSFGAALTGSLIFAALINHFAMTLATNVPFFTMPFTNRFGTDTAILRTFIFGPVFSFAPTLMTDVFQRFFASRYLVQILTGAPPIISTLFLWLAIHLAARRIAQHGHTAIETARQKAFRRRFLSPLFAKDLLNRILKRKLEKNLFDWLENRTPWSRVGGRLAFLLLLMLELIFLFQSDLTYEFFGYQIPLLFLFLFAIALKSAASFQYEKENGAFELLLVTPIEEPEIVKKRLRAVHRYFRPFALLLGVCALVGLAFRNYAPSGLVGANARLFSLCLSVITIPAAGLFFSLRFKSLLTALIWTTLLAIFGAPFLWSCFETLNWYLGYRHAQQWALNLESFLQRRWFPAMLAITLYHLILVTLSRRLATNLLQRRAFADPKTA